MTVLSDRKRATKGEEEEEVEDSLEALKERIHKLEMDLDYQKHLNQELSMSHGQVIAHLVKERPKATAANKNKVKTPKTSGAVYH